MVKEQYVNVDTAKLLKEMGFDSNECIAVYTELIPNEMELFIDDNILDYGIEDYMIIYLLFVLLKNFVKLYYDFRLIIAKI